MSQRWPLVLTLVASLFAARARAGSLDDVERASGGGRDRSRSSSTPSRSGGGSSSSSSASSSSGSSSSARSSGCTDDDCGGFAQLVALGLFYLVVSPFIIPHRYDDPCAHAYAASPAHDGFLRLAPWDEACAQGAVPQAKPGLGDVVRKLAGNVAAEGAYAQRGVWGGSISGQLLLPHRLELASRVTMLADLSERPIDQAVLSHTSFALRFAQRRHFAFRAGVGLRTFFLHARRFGPDALYGFSVYGRRGVRWDVEGHAGALGHAFAGEVRSTLGAMIGPVELFGGYDYFHVRGPTATATLHGPVLGLRLWL